MRGHAALEVGTDRDAEHHEVELGGGTHADVVTHADDEGTQVEGAAGTVGRNPGLVGLDHLLAGVDEHLGGDRRHQQAGAAPVHARGVAIGTEQVDGAVLAAIGLEAFEALLAVVDGRGAFADVQLVVASQLAGSPAAVAIGGDIAEVGLDVVETEGLPIDVRSAHRSSQCSPAAWPVVSWSGRTPRRRRFKGVDEAGSSLGSV